VLGLQALQRSKPAPGLVTLQLMACQLLSLFTPHLDQQQQLQ
jgi:hypothetical protein